MKEILLHETRILVGESLQNISRHLVASRVIAITSPVVRALHGRLFPCREIIEIDDDEARKTLATIDRVIGKLVDLQADRETFILGVGGGIVCDVAVFAASIYMRGCPFGLVPTTLLAQVEAGVGGKNGVNHAGYKNMIGVFARPRIVLCDPALPATLSSRDYTAGFAEIVKAAMIADLPLFDYLERSVERARQRDRETIEHLVRAALQVKVDIVARDEREQGDRRLLNLGHTFAHAIERLLALSHGEAVSAGLCIASRLSCHLGLMNEEEYRRVVTLLERLGLPVAVDTPLPALLAATRADKKKSGDSIHLVLPVGIGHCETRLLAFEALEKLARDIL